MGWRETDEIEDHRRIASGRERRLGWWEMIARLVRFAVGFCLVLAGFSACGTPDRDFASREASSAGRSGAAGAAGAAGRFGTTGGASGYGGSGPTDRCSAGDQRCDDLTPERCTEAGDWVATQASCAVACSNAECVKCKDGTTTCKDGAVQKCVAGAWTTLEVCPKACQDGGCVDACTGGSLQCNGEHSLQKCVDGAFVDDKVCDFLCSGGACSGACVPDDRRCNPSASNESQVCSAKGVWDQSAPCPGGTFCVTGKCAACMPGSARCMSGPQLCSDAGEWVNQAPCVEPTAGCFEGKCVACNPGDKRCTGASVEQCAANGGSWAVLATCSGDTPACLASTKKCGKCAQGDLQCLDNKVQTCDAQSVFQTTTTCSGTTPRCTGGKCSECDPSGAGERRCASTASTQSCSPSGAWAAATTCSGDTPLCRTDLNFKCGCQENARRCRSSTVAEVCQGGAWVAQSACSGTLDSCLPATGQCVDCVPPAAECRSGVAYQCNDAGAFVSLSSCSGPSINCGNCGVGDACAKSTDCATGFCVGQKCAVCNPGDKGCAGTTPRLCSATGAWTNQTTCAGTTPQCLASSGACVACTNGATQSCGNCNTGSQTCTNNAWGTCTGAVDLKTNVNYCGSCSTKCSTGQLCENGACVVDCGTKTRCGTACVDLTKDASNCSACGMKCPVPTNGSAVCASSACDISCSNMRCGTSCCAAAPAGATTVCSGNTCTFPCSSGNHSCSGACYGSTDATHCGTSCVDCSKYVGTTGTCSSNQCACESSSTLLCGASTPTCGSWDFDSANVEGWRYANNWPDNHQWVGTLGTTFFSGSPALSAKFDSLAAGEGIAEFTTDLCPNSNLLNLTGYNLGFDFYFQTAGGATPFSQDDEDHNDLYIANGSGAITACMPMTQPGSDQLLHATCGNLPATMTNLTIVFRLQERGWAGNVYIDNIKFTPK